MYTKQTMLVLFNIMFMYWERVDIKRHNNPSQTSRKLKEKAHVCLSKNTNIYIVCDWHYKNAQNTFCIV